MSNEQQYSDTTEMNYLDHFSELRKRLIWTAIVFLIFFIIGFLYVKDIEQFFMKDIDIQLTLIAPGEIIWIYFMMAFLVGAVGTIPFLCIQIWLFVRPGLTTKERRVSLSYIPAIFILFSGGLVFGYYVFVELILPFLLSLNDGMFNEMFTVENYFRFLFRVTFPFAVLFEIPIITMFLTSLGIVTPAFLRKTRKYAYFILIVIGTMISPPDFILQIVVAIPLIILYEISVVLSGFVYRNKQKKHETYMDES
ncbi:twin-arginine translocase subunit TatC [Aquibacillus koreensis]|uniref:Sec-independent protein translocase protein TatC n=1 Tax=Aquibacillus koreensis TaxID=279446 RepID=A0A9X3WR98_9BACI|nr:twin-arginine translocase subunit TatC [Aquibacillus koreensis]MCT2535052.1 twin-arginine translocase subunit TatC [Aquibacillus koreensis]MDC3422826.1 twin-arginine translocase subunit TatC [Aquibacillus koreensis]